MESPQALDARLKRFQDGGDLRRRGSDVLVFIVMVGDESRDNAHFVNYQLAFAREADGVLRLVSEQLSDPEDDEKGPLFASMGGTYMLKAAPQPAWRRERKERKALPLAHGQMVIHSPMPPSLAPVVARLLDTFRRVEIVFDLHLRCADPRHPDDLERRAQNIAAEWAAIRAGDEAGWQRALSLARVVLGPRLGGLTVTPATAEAPATLAVMFAGDAAPTPAASLPQDPLTWLATIPLVFQQPHKSLLTLDQPERQLSPLALATLIRELKRAETPVLITTESNVPLQFLDDAVDGLYVGRMAEPDRAVYYRPEPERVWAALRRHGDLAWVRASGAIDTLLGAPEPDDLAEGP